MRAVGGACTSAQLRVFTLCNQLQEVSRSFSSFIARLPAPAATVLRYTSSQTSDLQKDSKGWFLSLMSCSTECLRCKGQRSNRYIIDKLFCRPSLEALEAGTIEVVLPLVRALVDKAENLVLKMHEQDFGQEGTPAVIRASPYISDLARHLSHSRYT